MSSEGRVDASGLEDAQITNAGIIMRSSDNIDFHVFKLLLSRAPSFSKPSSKSPSLPKRIGIRRSRVVLWSSHDER
ncbi:hypothetical protein L210DRAFT_3523401 [Boletus edulis BED1]|uniref:Uncharacterized protein n=1 Tax=Boletus edulis BED1 TaxID=1328754 RepID=A0AAD4C616_BOLED|nr:hypothetical protein L210DRAFT_3523401 [Boletus edulis BED1]